MPNRRRPFAGLLRVLQNAAEPVYVLDEQRRIAFANDACLAWVGLPWNELFGRTCLYQTPTEPSGPEAIAAALAAPPRTERGESAEDLICLPSDSPRPRRAAFIPLRWGAGSENNETRPPGVLVVVEPADSSEPAESAVLPVDWITQPDDAHWHLWVQRAVREVAVSHGVGRLIGHSAAMRRTIRQVEAAKASRANVLFVGPTGAQTAQIASAVHFGIEPDAAGALVPVDCAVLDDDMIRSSVRAVAAGAAVGRSSGRSALLLLRIDLLSEPWQRALWEEIRGPKFPLRVMATVERPNAAETFEQLILPELLAAIAAIVVSIPPLARRRDDIPLLAQFFLEQCNAVGKKQVERFSPEAIDLLDHYYWPNDMAEMEQLVRQAHARAEGPVILPADLPRRIHWTLDAHRRRPRQPRIQLDSFLRQAEKELIVRALRQARGNRAKAARLLGVSRPRLYRRMLLLGLANSDASGESSRPRAPASGSVQAEPQGEQKARRTRQIARRPAHADELDREGMSLVPSDSPLPTAESGSSPASDIRTGGDLQTEAAGDRDGNPAAAEAAWDNAAPIFEEAEPPTEPEE